MNLTEMQKISINMKKLIHLLGRYRSFIYGATSDRYGSCDLTGQWLTGYRRLSICMFGIVLQFVEIYGVAVNTMPIKLF
jgi:hypothetical protein